mgnify:FL=1
MKIKNNIYLFSLNKIQLIKKINTLENDNLALQNIIKDELYKTFIEKLEEPQEITKLKKDNLNLRKKNKLLKQLLKDDNSEL